MLYYAYKIENLINHKTCVGLTNNPNRRKARHFADLKARKHDKHFLQSEYDKYGKANFSFEIVLQGDFTEQEIGEKERFFIETYDSYQNGYNQNRGGNFGASNGGTKLLQKDVIDILVVSEYCPTSGQILASYYDVSGTTIMRINKGVNHLEAYLLYLSLTLEEKDKIFIDFCKAHSSFSWMVKKHSRSLKKRKLTDMQALKTLVNFEHGIMPVSVLARKFKMRPYVLDLIKQGKTYRDCRIKYLLMSQEEKSRIVSLLREEQ